MDTTGGNSGSPILDAYGNLIGVNFDRAYEATTHTQGLANLGKPFDELVLVYLMASKLDLETKELWETFVSSIPLDSSTGKSESPKAEVLFEFLNQRARTLEHCLPSNNANQQGLIDKPKDKRVSAGANGKNKKEPVEDPEEPPSDAIAAYGNDKTKKRPFRNDCHHCKESHAIWACDSFKHATMEVKMETVHEANLCTNCLSVGHQRNACWSTYTCKYCKQKHHSLLHEEDIPDIGNDQNC